ncbi:MAG: transcription-repair coupling factor [Phycisphaeraceae bacterium]|nr:transcription-repair coupling factor [Phycisphaeraceae bacterium]
MSRDHSWLVEQAKTAAVEQLLDYLQSGGGPVNGAAGSSTHLLAGAVAARRQCPVLLVVAHLDDADEAAADLDLYDAAGLGVPVQRFGAMEVLPGESAVNLELLAERLAVVEQIADGPAGPQVLVAPIQALMQTVPRPEAVREYQLTLQPGTEIAPAELIAWLERAGYRRTDAVENPGDYATRGGIVDLFLPTGDNGEPLAVRLEYFGDEIDTLTTIDPDTLASGDRIDQARLIGASTERLQQDDRTTGLASLLPETTVPILAEPLELAEQARGYFQRLTNPRGIIDPQDLLRTLTQRAHLEVHAWGGPSNAPALPIDRLAAFSDDTGEAIEELTTLATDGDHRVVVLCENDAERERLTELITDHDADALKALSLEIGYLHRGFTWRDATDQPALTLVPHHELFHRYHARRRVRRVSIQAAERGDHAFLDLAPGDYVVHESHGIGRYLGMRTMSRHGHREEYLTLEFADQARLNVPATEAELVQKYIGGFRGRPPLSKLGGARWQRQKESVSESVESLAAELLRVQAAREATAGIRCEPDTPWQREFEASFPYEETADQLAAIAAIKDDMTDPTPMDRLICGDVGFGKTEVAMRAAFKAVDNGHQVAVLVPTTVLAEQHERTFHERMAEYPYRIGSLSRFRSAPERRAVLEELADGRLDIVIGTHRLLSDDVQFHDLGLVVIDEEQRFGVKHKQKLLSFRLTADVLTLSATPIPRTLHMAMLGLRNISSLSTPPADRRSLVTEVVPWDEDRIQHAIERELAREGQVYYVHNRVHDIDTVANDVRTLVPDATVVVGHGQMTGRELEKVMLQFLRGEADILVCTTIIESGVDIPRANTMIIDDADHYGLADLHQLRGRVGRWKHRAYCYLLLPPERPITDEASRRLKAIEQYSMLGAGFKIAMRDLEIRGAGNLLGPEQSGHIAAVGYEMYCRLLERAARRLKNQTTVEPVHTHLQLGVGGRISPDWIPSEKHRLAAYRRLARAADLDACHQTIDDLTDAWGEPNETGSQFLRIARIRVAAATLGLHRLKRDGADLIFQSRTSDPLDALESHLKSEKAPGRVTRLESTTLYYRPPEGGLDREEDVLRVLERWIVGWVEGGL